VFYKLARYSLHQVEGHLNLAKQKLQNQVVIKNVKITLVCYWLTNLI